MKTPIIIAEKISTAIIEEITFGNFNLSVIKEATGRSIMAKRKDNSKGTIML